MKRKLWLVWLLGFLLSCSLAVGAAAEPAQVGSITVELVHKDTPLAGASLTVYRLGDFVWHEDSYQLVLDETFGDAVLPATDLHTQEAAKAYSAFVHEHTLEGITVTANADGVAVFDSMPLGVYLIDDCVYTHGGLTLVPFIVSIPMQIGEDLVYDPDASPKVSFKADLSQDERPPTPEEPSDSPDGDTEFPEGGTTKPSLPDSSDTPENTEKIPQTGMLQWPVPLLAVGGVLLILLGCLLVTDAKRCRHEA